MSRAKAVFLKNETVGPFGSDESTISLPTPEARVRQTEAASEPAPHPVSAPKRPLHRLAAMREEQGISLTRVAQRLGVEIAVARQQEQPGSDLTLSQLYRWRDILEVPIGELLLTADGIPDNPIKTRGQMIKMMKSVRAIIESSKEEGTIIQARLLFELLIELMPELKSVGAWPSVGQSRESRDLGQAAYRRFDPQVSRALDD